MAERWRPLSARADEKAAGSYDSLHDGIPVWLKNSIANWIERAIATLCQPDSSAHRYPGPDPVEQNVRALLMDMERLVRKLRLGWASVGNARIDLVRQAVTESQVGLVVIDYLLHVGRAVNPPGFVTLAEQLAGYLEGGGSKWRVAADHSSLEKRVGSEAATRAGELTTGDSRAAQHLRDAWHCVYGRSPNPSHAYREAIRAVEVVAIPVVSPNNSKATLGTVIGEMKATPNKWAVAFQPSKGDPVQHVIGMLELLWHSQLDRHGTADESVPLSVSKEEAEAAVHLALTLVHWFQSGTVRAK